VHRSCPSVCPSVSLSVSLSVCRQNAKKRFSQKLSNLELWCLLTTYRNLCKLNWAFQRTHYWIPTIQDGLDLPSWESTWRLFFCRGWSDLDKISQTGTEWHVDCSDMWKWKPYVEFQYGGRLGEFNGMSSHSHVSHYRVLPFGEFTVTITEPHATLQGTVTWRKQCCDPATLQGVRIPSGILKSFFAIFYFCGRPCYVLPMFLFIYFLWPPYSPALVNEGSRKFYTWWTLSVIREVSTWIFS